MRGSELRLSPSCGRLGFSGADALLLPAGSAASLPKEKDASEDKGAA